MTNLITSPEDLSAWSLQAVTIDTDVATAPDNSDTMDRMNVTAVGGVHDIFQSKTVTANTNYSTSAFFKDDGAGFAGLRVGQSGNAHFIAVVANLTTGEITDQKIGTDGINSVIVDAGVEAYPNDIYRVWMTGRWNSTSGLVIPFVSNSGTPTYSDGRPTYTGIDGEDVFMWGVQFELGDLTAYTAVSGAISPFGGAPPYLAITRRTASQMRPKQRMRKPKRGLFR